MFDEFLECTANKDRLETVTIVCDDCVMQVTLKELRFEVKVSKLFQRKVERVLNIPQYNFDDMYEQTIVDTTSHETLEI